MQILFPLITYFLHLSGSFWPFQKHVKPVWATFLICIYSLFGQGLTLPVCKTTTSNSSKMKELADDNFKFDENGRKVLQTGRKHCGKRRNCSLQAISPFSTVFNSVILETRKNQGLFGKGLTHFLIHVHHFETVPKSKKLQTTTEMVLRQLKCGY